jgi:hypothetical protein
MFATARRIAAQLHETRMFEFYDRRGNAVAYSDDNEHIYSWDGRPIAFISGREYVYAFSGNFLGWLNDGWIRDVNGDAMLFTQAAIGGPQKPMLNFQSFKGFKQFLPFKGFKDIVPFKPSFSMRWSDVHFW